MTTSIENNIRDTTVAGRRCDDDGNWPPSEGGTGKDGRVIGVPYDWEERCCCCCCCGGGGGGDGDGVKVTQAESLSNPPVVLLARLFKTMRARRRVFKKCTAANHEDCYKTKLSIVGFQKGKSLTLYQ